MHLYPSGCDIARTLPSYTRAGRKINFCVAVVIEKSGVYLQRLPTKGDAKTHTMKTSTTTVTISIHGIGLVVTGTYTPEEPRTWEHPGVSAEFEIESVKLADPDSDIFDLLDYSVKIDDIVTAAIEAYEGACADTYEAAWEDYCEAREEERKLNR